MRKSRFTAEQIIAILAGQERGFAPADRCVSWPRTILRDRGRSFGRVLLASILRSCLAGRGVWPGGRFR